MKRNMLLLAVLFVLLAIPALYLNAQAGVFLGDAFFRQTAEGSFRADASNFIDCSPTASGARFSFTLNGTPSSAELRLEDNLIRFDRENGDYLVAQQEIEGFPLFWNSETEIPVNSEASQGVSSYALCNCLYNIYRGRTERHGVPGAVLLALVTYEIGALCLFFPEKMHFLGGRWQYSVAELSAAGRLCEQACGVLLLLGGVVLLYLPLLIR